MQVWVFYLKEKQNVNNVNDNEEKLLKIRNADGVSVPLPPPSFPGNSRQLDQISRDQAEGGEAVSNFNFELKSTLHQLRYSQQTPQLQSFQTTSLTTPSCNSGGYLLPTKSRKTKTSNSMAEVVLNCSNQTKPSNCESKLRLLS